MPKVARKAHSSGDANGQPSLGSVEARGDTRVVAPSTPRPDVRLTGHARGWLIAVAVLMGTLVGVGAWVRLLDAGLSIVVWQPVFGVLPPMTHAQWEALYDAYKRTPQYVQLAPTLDEFRTLFWPEYVHRVLGRLVFLALAAPLIASRVRAKLGVLRARRMGLVATGVVFQGTVGWVMVASGLRDRPMVHPWLLAFHLGTATLLLLALTAELDPLRGHRAAFTRHVQAIGAAAFVVMVLGAAVAGLRAGVLYPTFPSFGGRWLPPEVAACEGLMCLQEGSAVHWAHRMAAYGVSAALLVVVGTIARTAPRSRAWALRTFAHLALQITLGAAVVLTHVSLPLAVLHQLNAVALVLTLAALARRAG